MSSNVRQLTDHGVPVYPITDRSLVIGLHEGAFATYVMAWDGASTPVPANIPAGVVVNYNGTDYTGTLAASASTAQDLYLVASATQQDEYDRYITTHTGSTYAWNPLASTAIVSPVIADDLVTNDASKALSAKQGKVLGDKTSELEAEVTDLEGGPIDLSQFASQKGGYNNGNWYAPASGYEVKAIPLRTSVNFVVRASTTDNAGIFFVKTLNIVNGQPIDLCDGESYIAISKGTTIKKQSPKDATYIVVQVLAGGQNRAPEYIGYEGAFYLFGRTSEIDNTLGETLSQQITITVPASAQIIKDIDCDLKSGEYIELSLTGPDGVLTQDNTNYFLDVTNQSAPFGLAKYNLPLRVILTKDTQKIRCVIGTNRMASSGEILFSVKQVPPREMMRKTNNDVAALGTSVTTVVGNDEKQEKELNGYTLSKDVAISYPASTTIISDITCDLKKGDVIELLVSGDNGILNELRTSYFLDVTNNIYFPATYYNESVRVKLTADTIKIRVLIGNTRIIGSGTVVFSVKKVSLESRIKVNEENIDNIMPRLSTLEEESTDRKFAIPGYYLENDYIQDKIARINALAKDAVGNGDAFIFITDEHWPQNAKKSPALVRYIAKNTHIYNIFSGGDTGEGGSDAFCTDILTAWGRDVHHAAGNHDFDGSGTPSRLYYMFSMQNKNEDGEPQKQYYFVDNIQAKLRYIFLVANGPDGYSNEQLAWFNSAMNVESGWGILVFIHYLVTMNWLTNDVYIPNTGNAANFVSAVQNYSGNGEIIALFQGHWHRDRIVTTLSNNFPAILTTSDKYVASTTTISGQTVQDIDVTRTLGTISEQAFDVVIVNRTTKTINLVRIGGLARDGVNNSAGDEVEERVATWGE